MIPFSRHVAAPREAEYVLESLQSGAVSGDGPHTRLASALLSTFVGGAPVLLTTSCSHALEMMPLLLGLQAGDEVVMPSYTFASTANAFALRGIRIRFADIDANAWSMGPDEVEAAWTEQTRAVVAVAYNGVSHRIGELATLCERRGIPLVLDAAQAFGATHHGRPVASYGRLSSLSFHATKNLSCGEGGALILNDRTLQHQAEMVREKGTDRSRFLRGEVDRYTWRTFGSSYVLSDILAGVLRAQLEQAEGIQRHRQQLFSIYDAALRNTGATLPRYEPCDRHPAHMAALLVPTAAQRGPLIAALGAQGIKAVSHYEPLHRAPAHAGREHLPVTDDVAARIVRLPLHGHVTPEDAARMGAAVAVELDRLAREHV